jgi:hypothetical protein
LQPKAASVQICFDSKRQGGVRMLESLLKIGGVTALTIGVFYLLYKQILSLKIFAKLGRTQTFVVVCFLAVLVWLLAMTTLLFNDQGATSLIFGSGNSVFQNSSVSPRK